MGYKCSGCSIREGFGKQLMFGSDQMVWPEAISMAAKAGRLDHIWSVRLQLSYITKQQALNSGFWWSI
jgi:hypothetical protein